MYRAIVMRDGTMPSDGSVRACARRLSRWSVYVQPRCASHCARIAFASCGPTLGVVPARAVTLRSSAFSGSCGAFLATYSQCSIVERPKRMRSSVEGWT